MRVSVFSTKPYEIPYLNAASQGQAIEWHLLEESLNEQTAPLAAGSEAVLLFTSDKAHKASLEILANLGVRQVVCRSAGYDHVDLEASKALGLRVSNTPEYSPYAIAEHSVLLMLALNRHLMEAQEGVRRYDFRLDRLIGFDMNGKTVGLIGCGKIGAAAARILYGFGCHLLGFDPYPDNRLSEQYGLRYTPLEELLAQSDIVSLYCPYNPHTHYLLNSQTLGQMKPGALLINTARGAIVDTSALISALESGHVGGAGLDVYEWEKGFFFHDKSGEVLQDGIFARLLSFKNVIVTGHQAYLTETALRNIFEASVYNLLHPDTHWRLA